MNTERPYKKYRLKFSRNFLMPEAGPLPQDKKYLTFSCCTDIGKLLSIFALYFQEHVRYKNKETNGFQQRYLSIRNTV